MNNHEDVIIPMDDFFFYNPDLIPVNPRGLVNSSDHCWLNSLIQLLTSLPAFIHAMKKIPEDRRTPFTNELTRIITEDSSVADNPSGLHREITRALATARGNMVGRGQSCVDEAFTAILGIIDDKYTEHMFDNAYGFIIWCTGCREKVSDTRDVSNRVVISERRPLETPGEFLANIVKRSSKCSEYRCDKCGKILYDVPRVEFIRMVREIIVVVFDKFYTKEYLYHYPEFLTFPRKGGGEYRYRLCAIIEHYGTAAGGHYIARAYRHGKWYRFNDTSVTPAGPEPTRDTFMVAYHIIE